MAPNLAKSLQRLSRTSLIDLCIQWSQPEISTPYLATNRDLIESEEEDYLHEPAQNTQELQKLYNDLKSTEGEKTSLSKQDIIDRIIDGDWRRGLSLHQHAMIDFAYLEQCDSALRWSALKLVHQSSPSSTNSTHPAKRRKTSHTNADRPHYPQVNPSIFVANLKAQISPLVKAHYKLNRLASGLAVLRMYIVPNTAFAPSRSSIPKITKDAIDAARLVYIALPDSCPYVYISVSGGSSKSSSDSKTSIKSKVDIATIKKVVIEAIPKALSRPQERWSLESTKLTTRSLKSICLLRGHSRPGTAGGAYSNFSSEYNTVDKKGISDEHCGKGCEDPQPQFNSEPSAPLRVQLPTPPPDEISELQLKCHRRFGTTSGQTHAALDRFHVKFTNIFTLPPTNNLTSTQSKATRGAKKRKRLSLEEIENGTSSSQPQSHAAQVLIPNKQELSGGISITMSGCDVFAGLKQLALLGPEYVDLSRLPAWATGEKGVSSLTI